MSISSKAYNRRTNSNAHSKTTYLAIKKAVKDCNDNKFHLIAYLSGDDAGLNTVEKEFEKALRPQTYDDFFGQGKVIENIKVFVQAAANRNEPLDHVLLHGPPGLGKTTLSHIISNELKSNLKITSGPVLDKPGDLAGLLTNLENGDVLFIDEIHRLNPVVEEYLY